MARKTLKNMLDIHKQFQKEEDIKIPYNIFLLLSMDITVI